MKTETTTNRKEDTMRIPNTLREYTKAIRHGAATIYRTSYGWQIPVNESGATNPLDPAYEIWLASKTTLAGAKDFVDRITAEGRSHIFAR